MDRRIFHLRELMLKNLKDDWTIEKSAQLIVVSAPYLQKLFREELKVSPMAYLRDLRLTKACELLETTFKNISEIGYEVGMPNDSHFTRDFKKKFGLTPTEYRKQFWDKTQTETSDGQK